MEDRAGPAPTKWCAQKIRAIGYLKPRSNHPDTPASYAENTEMVAFCRALFLTILLVASVQPALADGETLRATVLRVDLSRAPQRDVYVAVSDARGLPVTGLDRGAFDVAEDGAPVQVDQVASANDSQQPIAFGLLIDVSGSMAAGGKLDAAKRAANSLVATMGPADTAAVISFANKVDVVQEFTGDRGALGAAIDGLQTDGDTSLYDALDRGVLLADALPQTRRVLLVVTDGDDTRSTTRLNDLLGHLASGRSVTYAVGLGTDVNRGVLDRLAGAGAGQSVYPADPADLDGIFQSVLNQLRLTYVVRYTAAKAAAGAHTVAANVAYQGQTAQAQHSFTIVAPAPVVAEVTGLVSDEVVNGPRQVVAVLRSGSAQRMDLLVDGQIVVSSVGAPTSVTATVSAQAPGAHSVSVRTTDAQGGVTENQVAFAVPGPPTPAPTLQPVAAVAAPLPAPASDAWTWWVLLGAFVLVALAVLFLALRRRPAAASSEVAAAVADDATLEIASVNGAVVPTVAGPRLVVQRDGQQLEVALADDTFSIGRETNNNLVLRDPLVSRHHALITRQQDAYWIEDLKSQNGTLLDGRVRIERKQLEAGDEFAIGAARVTFATESPTSDGAYGEMISAAVASAARS
jgi:VWFA-related protein